MVRTPLGRVCFYCTIACGHCCYVSAVVAVFQFNLFSYLKNCTALALNTRTAWSSYLHIIVVTVLIFPHRVPYILPQVGQTGHLQIDHLDHLQIHHLQIHHLQVHHLQIHHLQIHHLQIHHLQIPHLQIHRLQIHHLQIHHLQIHHLQIHHLQIHHLQINHLDPNLPS